MCGIAGIVDLEGSRPVDDGIIARMARALTHRGPDEEGVFSAPGIALAARRLSIVGLADGGQPVFNENGNLVAVFNGELFDHRETRAQLEARGHRLVKQCDTELLPHLWEEHGAALFEKLRGQFAIALWDRNQRRLVLARDRFGICPLYWTRQGGWLLFASEIKALLASGIVPARPDRRGIDHAFTFSAQPAPLTCFEGIQSLRPAHFLDVTAGSNGSTQPREQAYWALDFPDAGDEEYGEDEDTLVDTLEDLLLNAVKRRLQADVPVGTYLSGGVDSAMIAALGCHVHGGPLHTYTVSVDAPGLDELESARHIASHVGAHAPIVQPFRAADAVETYPALIQAAEAPVTDTSCASLLQLARRVHAAGQKVVLTGEGSDEWLVGYPWYKIAKVLDSLDGVPGLHLSEHLRRAYCRFNGLPLPPPDSRPRIEAALGGPNAWIDAYGMLSLARPRFYSAAMHEATGSAHPWEALEMPLERARRWHPLHRGVWVAARVTLGGHLLQAKGDRVAMHSSVEVRYPFLDEDVAAFLARLHPRWKLRGFRDKHLLRLLAARWLPSAVHRRSKAVFRAPLDSFHLEPEPTYVGQLLSAESLRRSGYFDPASVQHWRHARCSLRQGSFARLSVEAGLAGVIATQLWHHHFIDPNLADLQSAPTPT